MALDGSDKPRQHIRVEPRVPPTPAAAGKPNSKFSSLEDQKLAADDWPRGVAFPSPKEGEISASIWQRLRLKLVPATPEELKAAGTPYGIRIRNEFSENLVPNGKQPFILTKVNDVSLTSFDDLLKVHMQLNSSSDHFVTCTLMSDGKTHQLQRERNEAVQPTPRTDSTAKSHSKFPALEDQKLADLAWKRLGLELEPITADDLQRVKALGYDGGLKVVGGGSAVVGDFGTPVSVLPNDILVGLHVWPTTNLKDIVTVLNREDLAELNPLKFYVVRPGAGKNQTGPMRQPEEDRIITGRINVQVAAQQHEGLKDEAESVREALETANERLYSLTPPLAAAQKHLEQAKAKGENLEAAQHAYDTAEQQFKEARQSQVAAIHRLVQIEQATTIHPAPPLPLSAIVPSTPYERTVDRYNAGPSTTTPAPPEHNAPALHSVLINPTISTASNETSSAGQMFDRLKKQLQMYENARNKAAELISLTKRAKEEASKRLQKGDGPNEDTERAQLQIKMADRQLTIAEAQLKGFQEQYAKAQKEFDEFTRSDRYSRMLAAQPTTEETPTSDSPPLAPRASQLAPSTSAPPILAPQTLRYDGKPFEEWQNVWKTELSTEKRIEAVKALAAFGRAGYGQEAAAAILDVAGEYDYNRSGDLDKALRETIEDALIFKVPAKDWLPDLRARYAKAPDKWKSLALVVLKNARDADEADAKRNRNFLLQLSRSPDWSFTDSAISSLVKRYPDAPETTQRLLEVLKDKEHWLSAVEWFGKTKQFPPEVIDLVLHGDDKQQAKIRAKFFLAANSPAYVSALQALLEILKNDSKPADHLAAIRAIGTGRTSDSLPQPDRDAALEVIVEKGPLNLRIAAAVALQNATGGRIQSFPLLEKKLGDLSQHKVTRNELLNLHNHEATIQHPQTW